MRGFLLLLILLIVAGVFLVNGVKQKVKNDLAQPLASSSQTSPTPAHDKTVPIVSEAHDTTSLFVPYWTLGTSFSDTAYDKYLYFGVTPGAKGINEDENGFNKLEDFTSEVPDGKHKLLVLRMLESDNNLAILKDKQKQKQLIAETNTLAYENGFDGVVLDLELSAIPFDSLIAQIRNFNADFYAAAKRSGLSYGVTIYGDTFYRLRPFDVKAIGQNADTIYIMAYDFHKSRGNPGPNFPLNGKNTYGYDMAAMSDDFLKFVPKDKLTVVFGLFGYDWEVDGKGNAVSHGEALTEQEITGQFIADCKFDRCNYNRDSESKETSVRYSDNNKAHIVWFEDIESVKAKESYLRGKGITSFSFWANSYF